MVGKVVICRVLSVSLRVLTGEWNCEIVYF